MGKRTYYLGAGGRHTAPRGTQDTDVNAVTEGIASTGQVSKKGTVTHIEHRDGSVDATVRPRAVKAKIGVKQ